MNQGQEERKNISRRLDHWKTLQSKKGEDK